MKTIEEAAKDFNDSHVNGHHPQKWVSDIFKAGVEFAQQYTSVEDKLPDANIQDDEGIFYSEYLLIKVKGYEHPFVGYYVKANDDEFFDIYPEVSEIVNQEDITHYRYIDLK